MSIHPQYAEAILNGSKQVEFRKRQLASDIEWVLIYATSPVQQVVGYFSIQRTVSTTPNALWRAFNRVAGISRKDYQRYFQAKRQAIGLVVDTAHRLQRPLTLAEISAGITAPQSFVYLPGSALDRADQLSGSLPDSQVLCTA